MRETLSTKKTLIIIAIIGLVAIGALLIYGIMVTPARQPYRNALTQYQNTNNALARTSVSVNSAAASDEEFNKNIEAVQGLLASLEKENEALANEEVLRDGEGKDLYAAYNKDLSAYIAYNKNALTSMQKVRPVFRSCSGQMDGVTADAGGAAVMQTCATDMQAANDVPDAQYKQLAESFQKTYAELASIFAQMAALSDQGSVEYKALVTQRDTAANGFSEASATFSKDVQQQRKSILNTNSANKLKLYLEDESRIF